MIDLRLGGLDGHREAVSLDHIAELGLDLGHLGRVMVCGTEQRTDQTACDTTAHRSGGGGHRCGGKGAHGKEGSDRCAQGDHSGGGEEDTADTGDSSPHGPTDGALLGLDSRLVEVVDVHDHLDVFVLGDGLLPPDDSDSVCVYTEGHELVDGGLGLLTTGEYTYYCGHC